MRACLKYIITLLFVSLNIQSSASIIRLYNFESDLITENTIPKRLYIDGGYIDININTNTTSYKYYVYGHQGSVRAVLNSSGTVIQSTDYSAYGVPSTRAPRFSSLLCGKAEKFGILSCFNWSI